MAADRLPIPQSSGSEARQFETVYSVDAKLVAGTIVYTMHADDVMVARAVLHPVRGCVTDTLVYREADFRIRRRRAEGEGTVTVMPPLWQVL